jgi:hypothetical protein
MLDAEFHESTRRLLDEPFLEGGSPDAKVRLLVKSEYMRRLGQYRQVDRVMASKYGMPFDQFVVSGMVREKEFSWDVETDAMNWETAISGIRTMERKLRELQQLDDA